MNKLIEMLKFLLKDSDSYLYTKVPNIYGDVSKDRYVMLKHKILSIEDEKDKWTELKNIDNIEHELSKRFLSISHLNMMVQHTILTKAVFYSMSLDNIITLMSKDVIYRAIESWNKFDKELGKEINKIVNKNKFTIVDDQE